MLRCRAGAEAQFAHGDVEPPFQHRVTQGDHAEFEGHDQKREVERKGDDEFDGRVDVLIAPDPGESCADVINHWVNLRFTTFEAIELNASLMLMPSAR